MTQEGSRRIERVAVIEREIHDKKKHRFDPSPPSLDLSIYNKARLG